MKGINPDIFSKNLRDFRTKKGFTQESLAEEIDSTHATINRWENGVSKPNFLDFYKLMQVLDLTFEELSGLEKLPKVEIAPKLKLQDALDVLTKETGLVLKLPKSFTYSRSNEVLFEKISKLEGKEIDLLNRTVEKMLNLSEKKKN